MKKKGKKKNYVLSKQTHAQKHKQTNERTTKQSLAVIWFDFQGFMKF
jgi:hypothetical protein